MHLPASVPLGESAPPPSSPPASLIPLSLCAGINPDTACRPPGLRFASSRSAPPPTVPLEVQFSPGIPMGAAMEANLLQQLKADKCIMAAEEALNGSVSDRDHRV